MVINTSEWSANLLVFLQKVNLAELQTVKVKSTHLLWTLARYAGKRFSQSCKFLIPDTPKSVQTLTLTLGRLEHLVSIRSSLCRCLDRVCFQESQCWGFVLKNVFVTQRRRWEKSSSRHCPFLFSFILPRPKWPKKVVSKDDQWLCFWDSSDGCAEVIIDPSLLPERSGMVHRHWLGWPVLPMSLAREVGFAWFPL